MDPTVKKRRGCLFPFIVIFIIFVAIIGGIAVGVPSNGGTEQKSLLAKMMDLTEEQEEAMLAVFDACGIVELKEVAEFQSGEDHTSPYQG